MRPYRCHVVHDSDRAVTVEAREYAGAIRKVEALRDERGGL